VILSAVRTSLVLVAALLVSAPAAVGSRDPNSPALRPVRADVRAAKTLLLRRSALGNRFRASPSGISPNNNAGSCAGFDPNLRDLTETAEVYGSRLTDRSEGLIFSSEAEVYISPAEATKAVTLESGPGAGRCVASVAKKAAGRGALVVKEKVTPVGFTVGGLHARAWDAQLLVRAQGRQLPVEATLFLFRAGRGLSAVFAAGIETPAASQYSRKASAQMVRALLRANLR
jgi:hypothetical protein